METRFAQTTITLTLILFPLLSMIERDFGGN
jgi:hypothetical protein